MAMNHGPYCTTKARNDNHVMNTHFPKLAEMIFSYNRKLTFKNDHFKILFQVYVSESTRNRLVLNEICLFKVKETILCKYSLREFNNLPQFEIAYSCTIIKIINEVSQ